MADPRLNELLKWSVENSDISRSTENGDAPTQEPRQLTAEMMAALMGGPSDADLMREAMTVIMSEDATSENKEIAFDNFEQLIENLDNANNMEALGLWTPLVAQLGHKEAEMRMYAAWCIKTAVQNNERAQERALVVGALPDLLRLAMTDTNEPVRKKAIGALSSATRNYQPALDLIQKELPKDFGIDEKLDAASMESVDVLIEKLRKHSQELA